MADPQVPATMPPPDAKAPAPASDPLVRPVNPNDPNSGGGSYGPFPILNNNLVFRELGNSGLRSFGGWIREEFLPQLQGRQAATKYREMMDNSPVIGGLMLANTATMRKVEWRVVPADDSGEAQEGADFVESMMHDMSHTWEDLVVENLTMLGYGFAPHEICYKRRLGRDPGNDPLTGDPLPSSEYDDGFVSWRKIPIRGQETVLKWFFNGTGDVKGMTQQPWTGAIRDLPIEKMLLFRPSQHKGNPEGRSILRSAYVPYYFLKRMQEQEAIMGERMGGLPMVKVPAALIAKAEGGDPTAMAQVAAYQRMAQNVRIDEQMGIMIPSDVYQGPTGPSNIPQYSFELVTPQGGRGTAMNFDVTITRYNTTMLTAALADFIMMGHNVRGAQNLGETKVDLFYSAVEGFLNSNAEVYNKHALPRIWRLNGWDFDTMPRIEPDLAVRADLDMLSNFVLRLTQAGMPIFPNDEVQSWLLDAGGLPDVTDERAVQAAGLTDEQLDMTDEQAQAQLENIKNPPAPGGDKTNLQKMLLGSLARRMIRKSGNTFNIQTRKRQRHGHSHSHRVAKYSDSQTRDDHGRWTSGGSGATRNGRGGSGRSKGKSSRPSTRPGIAAKAKEWLTHPNTKAKIGHALTAAALTIGLGVVEDRALHQLMEHTSQIVHLASEGLLASSTQVAIQSAIHSLGISPERGRDFMLETFDKVRGFFSKADDIQSDPDIADLLDEIIEALENADLSQIAGGTQTSGYPF